jgi:hypothetical protein
MERSGLKGNWCLTPDCVYYSDCSERSSAETVEGALKAVFPGAEAIPVVDIDSVPSKAAQDWVAGELAVMETRIINKKQAAELRKIDAELDKGFAKLSRITEEAQAKEKAALAGSKKEVVPSDVK